MEYREYGTTGKKLSVIGFGSTRFRDEDLKDEAGIARCAALVVQAAQKGINYFDLAHNYAKSNCEQIYRQAFAQIKSQVYTCAKSSSMTDPDAESVRRRVYSSLAHMQIEKIHFFYMWSIMNWRQYEFIMRKGGPYEGALQAQREGLIDHICFSNHATPEEAVRILDDGAFAGATISYSLLNFTPMQQVLDKAAEKKLGVTVMNPLAGGVVPQNPKYFIENFHIEDETPTDFSLRFIHAHPEITCILSGISSEKELENNVQALERPMQKDYITYVNTELTRLSKICTGCQYCETGCPAKIRIPAYTQAYNMKYMADTKELYHRTDPALIADILVMKKLVLDFQELPKDGKNPCVGCRKCEKICTQHLPIIKRVQEVLDIAEKRCCTQAAHRQRLEHLLMGHGYKKVMFYTGGGYTAYVLQECMRYFGTDFGFTVQIADSNREKWGQALGQSIIENPEKIPELAPDVIIISNFVYSEEIYAELMQKYPDQKIQRLHESTDAPWVY